MAEDAYDDFSDLDIDSVKPAESNVLPRVSSSRSGGTRGRRPAQKKLDQLKAALSKQMFQAGAMIGLGMPVTGYYIGQESDNFCDAIVALAAKKADWIDALEHVADIGPGITVGRTVLGVGAALGADRYYRSNGESGLDPDKRAAMFLGVTSAYYAVHPENVDAAAQNGYNPPPAVFVPVA